MDSHIVNEWTLSAATALAVLLFWAYRSLNKRCSDNEKANAALALHVAEEYVSVKRFEGYVTRFDDAVKVIFEKLDNVNDKLLDMKGQK
jgi:hypothetical protein